MTRIIARLGVAVLLLGLVGCLIKSPPPAPNYYSLIKIVPDNNLEAAPPGTIYQLWLLDLADLQNPDPNDFQFTALTRFEWDPENFRTLDEAGDPIDLYSPDGPGVETGVNLIGHPIMLLTVEPKNDPNPNLPDGPIMMLFLDPGALFGQPSQLELNKKAKLALDSPFGGIQPAAGAATFTLAAQSLQNRRTKEGARVTWRDTTEGQGIWFAQVVVADSVGEDTAGYNIVYPDSAKYNDKGTLFTRDIDNNVDGVQYNLWLFPKNPRESWSNFDDKFRFITPDLVFRDSMAQHSPPLDNPPPSTGINALGSNPIVRGLDTIGYMYFPNAPNLNDTCFLRVDIPESTYCTSEPDSMRFLPFVDTNLIVRQYTFTWHDTTTAPSLLNLPAFPPEQVQAQFEAWLIFDSLNNPEHPPLSLGRLVPGIDLETGEPVGRAVPDQSNPYTDAHNFDRNFHFPGEDFLDMSSRPDLPSPLNVLHIPGVNRVKVWITLEPINDWDYSMPFSQLLTYVGVVGRESQGALDSARTASANRGAAYPIAPSLLSFPLEYRPISKNRSDLAEGHNWPSMQVFVSNPYVVGEK